MCFPLKFRTFLTSLKFFDFSENRRFFVEIFNFWHVEVLKIIKISFVELMWPLTSSKTPRNIANLDFENSCHPTHSKMSDFEVVSFIFLGNEFSPTHGWSWESNFLMGNQKVVEESISGLVDHVSITIMVFFLYNFYLLKSRFSSIFDGF